VAEQARALGATTLVGEYKPTAKNGMVANHYAKLGFGELEPRPDGGHIASLPLHDFVPAESYMSTTQGV
jgi:predicted enzyme involved in methoxymalonyl-ACP biosynthesis